TAAAATAAGPRTERVVRMGDGHSLNGIGSGWTPLPLHRIPPPVWLGWRPLTSHSDPPADVLAPVSGHRIWSKYHCPSVPPVPWRLPWLMPPALAKLPTGSRKWSPPTSPRSSRTP